MIRTLVVLSTVLAVQQAHERTEKEDDAKFEQNRARALLEQFDEDGDGALSEGEAPEPMRQRFATIDTDDDDAIDEDELVQMMLWRRAGRRGPGGLMRRLMELDEDGDDRVHRDEVPEEMENLREMFEDVDRNGDGYLDARELAVLQRRLEKTYLRFP